MGNMVDLGSRLEGIASNLPLFTNSKILSGYTTRCVGRYHAREVGKNKRFEIYHWK